MWSVGNISAGTRTPGSGAVSCSGTLGSSFPHWKLAPLVPGPGQGGSLILLSVSQVECVADICVPAPR